MNKTHSNYINNKFHNWQHDNKEDIINLFIITSNMLEKKNIMIADKNKFYCDFVNYMYNSSKINKV